MSSPRERRRVQTIVRQARACRLEERQLTVHLLVPHGGTDSHSRGSDGARARREHRLRQHPSESVRTGTLACARVEAKRACRSAAEETPVRTDCTPALAAMRAATARVHEENSCAIGASIFRRTGARSKETRARLPPKMGSGLKHGPNAFSDSPPWASGPAKRARISHRPDSAVQSAAVHF